MYKFYTLTIFFSFYFLSSSFAQEINFTIGKRFESAVSNSIFTDSIVFYEENRNAQYYPLGIQYQMPLKGRLSIRAGTIFYMPGTDFAAYKKEYCSQCPGPVTKITGVSHPTLELPLLASYIFFKRRKWSANINLGISPAIRLKKEAIKQVANPPDFEPEIAEILNAAPSTIKTSYINYRYGLQIQYDRFSLEAFLQQNLSRSVGESLQVWGNDYRFTRRTGSLSVHLSYAVFRWEKNEE
jgi:hypothetical protein